MTEIILTPEQAQVIRNARESVALRDPAGPVVAVVEPLWSAEEIEEAQRRFASDQPRYTTAEVLQHLGGLAK